MNIAKWVRKGQCENTSFEDILVCIDGELSTLGPGKKTPDGVDCDGYINKDGSGVKVHGQTGIPEKKSKEWVNKHWRKCSPPGGGGSTGGGGGRAPGGSRTGGGTLD